MEPLGRRIKEAQQSIRVLEEMVQGMVADDPRDRLCIKAADYAVELASGLVLLVESGHSAAAAALTRPVIEASLTSLYFLFCSPLQWATAIERGEGYIPKYSRMLAACSKIPNIGPNLRGIDITPFHQLTHGDAMQLNRRMTGGPAFCIETQAMQVMLAYVLAIASAQFAVVAGGREHLQEVLHRLRAEAIAPFETLEPNALSQFWITRPLR